MRNEFVCSREYVGNDGVRYTLGIVEDDFPGNPRREDYNLGTMLCFYRRYILGDKTEFCSDNFGSWEEVEDAVWHSIGNKGIVLPLYLYDHGMVRIKVGSFFGLLPQGHAEFDSGQIGFIYVSDEQIRAYWDVRAVTKKVREKTESYLREEVERYDLYLSGNCYGWVVVNSETDETMDSCYGYMHHDPHELMVDLLNNRGR